MKKSFLLLAFMIPTFMFAQTYIPAGPVSGTWGYGGSPYIIQGDINVPPTATLEIQAGVEVLFNDWYSLTVNGSLKALGTSSNTILFSSTKSHLPWHGIRFVDTKVISRLQYCVIEQAFAIMDQGYFPENCGGGIACINSPLAEIIIQKCTIQNNGAYDGGGIYSSQSNPLIEECLIERNIATYGGGISIDNKSSAEIYNSSIGHNDATYGGALNINNADIELVGNEIMYNEASNCGGAIHALSSIDYKVSKNIIAYNNAAVGGALHLSSSDGSFCNNTITLNTAEEKGGGIYLLGISNPQIMNTIIFYNDAYNIPEGKQVYIQSNSSDPDFMYCNIEEGFPGIGGIGAGYNYSGQFEGNVYADPHFENASLGNFQVTWANYPYVDLTRSPCIDAGCPDVTNDPDLTNCDIGATYFNQILEIPVALEPLVSPSHLYFRAYWTASYGALGYLLDVAKDPLFSEYVFQGVKIVGDTTYENYLPDAGTYYYKVQAYNTAKTSYFSNVMTMDFPVTTAELSEPGFNIYTSGGKVYVNVDEQLKTTGEMKVFNMRGQLITEQRINTGLNSLNIEGTEQLVILKLMLDGKYYQEKVLLR